ncbi:MAG: T9SS type A sorting domain-containing protein [Bacteroidia bacterium]
MLRNSISFLLLAFLTFSFSQAQTAVSGGIYANTTWTLANSPYIMDGPIVVFPGKTLTIEPGVEVRVKYDGVPNTGLMHYLEIRGSLVAVGTPTAPIVFKSDTLPTEYTWLGIDVKGTQGGQIAMDYFELDNAVYGIYSDQQGAPTWNLHNCKFRYNSYALQPFGPMNLYDCVFEYNGQAIGSGWQVNHSINLKRCEFSNNTACNGFQSYLSADSCLIRDNTNGIWHSAGSVTNTVFERNTYAIYAMSGTLTNCVFTDNQQGLIDFSGTADNCTFSGNGLAAEMGIGGRLTNSTFTNDTVAVAYSGSLIPNQPGPVVQDNRICGSVNYYFENRSNQNFALDRNCFCETDSTVIEGLIYDGYDNIARGLFNYAIYDSTCQNIIQYVSKVTIPTSTDPALSGSFKLYPVPAGDVLYLSVPSELSGAKLTASLYDAQGRQIGETQRVASTELPLDLGSLPSGAYFVRVAGDVNETLRFMK